jgi:hypothetical protein
MPKMETIQQAVEGFMSGPMGSAPPKVRSMMRLAFLCGAYADFTTVNHITSFSEDEAVERLGEHERFLKSELTPEKLMNALDDVLEGVYRGE